MATKPRGSCIDATVDNIPRRVGVGISGLFLKWDSPFLYSSEYLVLALFGSHMEQEPSFWCQLHDLMLVCCLEQQYCRIQTYPATGYLWNTVHVPIELAVCHLPLFSHLLLHHLYILWTESLAHLFSLARCFSITYPGEETAPKRCTVILYIWGCVLMSPFFHYKKWR